MIKDNATVKAFLLDVDFRSDRNKHKYVLLWTSKFYRLINRIVRAHTLQYVMKNAKYTRHFIKRMVAYFYENGVYKKDLQKMSSTLYRGLEKEFILDSRYVDNGFMSTSFDLKIAKEFAGNDGNILEFKTNDLPGDVPFIILDDRIADHLHEKEVLFLPGEVTTQKKSKGLLKSTYTMHPFVLEVKKSMELRGGSGNESELYEEIIKEPDTNIDLRGKYVVWYRAIVGRHVEVFNKILLPSTHAEVEKYFQKNIMSIDDAFFAKTLFIPEYKDLRDKEDLRTEAEERLYASYTVHMAIYDPKTKKVLSQHYGLFSQMFSELFDTKREKDIEDEIIKKCEWLS